MKVAFFVIPPEHRMQPLLPNVVMRPLALAASLLFPALATAHFQELIPSVDLVTENTGNEIVLDLTFTHPMERGPAMAMAPPVRFGVLGPGGLEDLRETLTPVRVDDQPAFRAEYRVAQPGGYQFFVEPAPYWEPAEGAMIVHYTKVAIDAYGAEEGWDDLIGLPVEIQPLTRPFGLWTGNLFRGIVLHDGEPVPFAEVEVEWRNDGSVSIPADAFVTQVTKADAQGVFAYAMPRAGWWGFAALVEADDTMPNPDGAQVPVELGGLIWVHTRDMR
jgi:cobalt/nickel transport protein